MNKNIELLKKSYLIRKVETKFLDLFKQGKVSGTVHTCVGQEYTGAIVGNHFEEGDLVVSNHRGHGHYISTTNDIQGLVSELLGKYNGSSKGIGGSQHLINDGFISNGIQGGMMPIASGYALANKLNNKSNVSFAFLGDGTLGEGVLYETLNMCSNWHVPILFILENNGIAQSTSMKQSFSGNLEDRINGFGINYFEGSIYDLDNLQHQMSIAEKMVRNDQKPCFINIEVGRMNSHSKGDDNRDENEIKNIIEKDPLNNFFLKEDQLKKEWDSEFNLLIDESVNQSLKSKDFDLSLFNGFDKKKSNVKKGTYEKVAITQNPTRYNDLIYKFFNKYFTNNSKAFMLGEDIETMNEFHPKEYGGAFKVTKDLSILFNDRVKNTPISEQAIVGFGIGLALNGYNTFVEIMFGDFATLIFDQLYQHASKINLMFGKKVPLPLVVRTPMGGYRGYGPTHSQSIEKHFLGIPGLKVIALNQLVDPDLVYNIISKETQSVLVIENKMLYTRKLYENCINGYDLSHSNTNYPVAKLHPSFDEPVFTIVSYGGVVNEILLALEDLFVKNEIFCDLFVITDISSIDIPELDKSLRITNKLLVVEEGNAFAAFSSELTASLLENKINNFELFRISNNNIIPSSRNLELEVLPSKEKISSLIINNL